MIVHGEASRSMSNLFSFDFITKNFINIHIRIRIRIHIHMNIPILQRKSEGLQFGN